MLLHRVQRPRVDKPSVVVTRQTPGARPRDDRLFETQGLSADLKGRSVRGGVVTILAQGSKFVIQTVSMIALARLLTPADYGLIGMITAVTGFAALFNDLGLSMATVQKAQINHHQVSTLFWVNVALSVLIALVVAGLAPVLAWFYGEPRLTRAVVISAVLFVFGGLTVQHQALLRRQMRFSALAAIEILSLLFGAAVAIIAAASRAGYWSLILMSFAKATGSVLGVWVVCHWWPGWPVRRSGVREMLGFGVNLTGFHVLNYFARNLDNVLIGKIWGANALGFYSKAYGLLMLPLTQINAPVSAAAIPALSRLYREPARYRSYYLKCIALISFVTMPFAVFLVVMSNEVIRVILGPQWSEASRIFMFLGIAAVWQPVANSTGWLFVSQGRTADMFTWGIMGSSIMVFGIVLGLPWGTAGVAASYTLFNGVATPLLFWFVGQKGPVRTYDIYRAVVTPLGMSLGVLVVLLALKPLCADTTVLVRLICAITTTVGVVVTLLFVLPGGRQIMADIRDISHTIFAGR